MTTIKASMMAMFYLVFLTVLLHCTAKVSGNQTMAKSKQVNVCQGCHPEFGNAPPVPTNPK